MPKVSVIVPIYRVEKYIERCARSLFEQTLDEIEYIFVDDYTNDNSIAVLERVIEVYPNRKSQVTILHHDVNMGLPQARKTGVSIAKGEYIAHCDSDDWVDTDMYRAMYEKAEEGKADVVICDFYRTDGHRVLSKSKGTRCSNSKDVIVNLMFQRNSWSVCNKLFKKTVYSQDIVFASENMGEDMVLTLQLLQNCRKVEFIDKPLYYYYTNSLSITKNLTTKSVMHNFHSIKKNSEIVLNAFNSSEDNDIKLGLMCVQYNVKSHLYPLVHKSQFRELFLKTYPGLYRKMLFNIKIPIIYKLKYIAVLFGFYPRKVNN